MENNPERKVILYFGNDWWADNRTSSHHIARWLAQRHTVYYIECPGLRAPKPSKRDCTKLVRKLWRFVAGTTSVTDNLKVRTLFQIPLHQFRLVRWCNRLLITATLRWLMWRERIQNPIAWFTIPHLCGVVSHLGEQLSVYYCTDDYATLPDVHEEVVRPMDEALTAKADLVFTTAESLRDRKLHLNPNTHLSPHGVDVGFFGKAQDERLSIPSDTAHLPGPVVGFFGLIEDWIDLELMDSLSRQRPQWTFLLIGRIAVPRSTLPRYPNVHFIGQRPYESLPAYGKQFDVAIIPFRRTEVILHANPLKLREYLAMGKPIVSISTPEIDKYADVVSIAHSSADFLAKLDSVLAQPSSVESIRKRINRVAAESWDSRISEVFSVVQNHITAAGKSIGHLPPANGVVSEC